MCRRMPSSRSFMSGQTRTDGQALRRRENSYERLYVYTGSGNRSLRNSMVLGFPEGKASQECQDHRRRECRGRFHPEGGAREARGRQLVCRSREGVLLGASRRIPFPRVPLRAFQDTVRVHDADSPQGRFRRGEQVRLRHQEPVHRACHDRYRLSIKGRHSGVPLSGGSGHRLHQAHHRAPR